MAIFRQEFPGLTQASNAGRVGTDCGCRRIAGYWSMTAGRANNKCDNPPCSYRTQTATHQWSCI